MNWVDGVIFAVVAFYIIDGWEAGLWHQATALASFLGSLWLAVKYYAAAARFLVSKFGVPQIWSNVLGYAVVAIVSEIVLGELIWWAILRLPKKLRDSSVNRWLGATLSAAKGLVIVTLGLLLFLVLPLRGTIRQDINASFLGNFLVSLVETHAGEVKNSLDQAASQVVKFLTIKPQSNERINLDAAPSPADLKVDQAAEEQLVELVNQERVKAGAQPLKVSIVMTEVGRAYSKDMFTRKYFSHVSPEGKDVGDRLQAAGVAYQEAGENLAYAPDVKTAHEGLMNSEGHRKNILKPDFHRIGIGVIDGGIYGLMITQVFTN